MCVTPEQKNEIILLSSIELSVLSDLMHVLIKYLKPISNKVGVFLIRTEVEGDIVHALKIIIYDYDKELILLFTGKHLITPNEIFEHEIKVFMEKYYLHQEENKQNVQ